MLKRKTEKSILSWIENQKKALMVCGARGVGKTFTIRQCLKNAGCDFVEFNLATQPDIIPVLAQDLGTNDLILRLSLCSGKPLIPHKTFIFFNGVECYKELVTKIKFLVDDGRFRYILSGSLLGIEIRALKSAPVGYLDTITMYPLDFEEFLWTHNVSDTVISILKESYTDRKPVDSFIHESILYYYNLYLIIGGMPSAVEKYRTTKDINEVIAEHMAILDRYRQDFAKYETKNKKLILSKIYNLIPSELNDKNKRFKIAAISKSLRYDRIDDSFVWLFRSDVAFPAYNVSEPSAPLLLKKKDTFFKLFLSDTGLLTTLYGKRTKLNILNNEPDVNKGAVHENAIAQELYAHGVKLYCYNSHTAGELDFVIEHNGKILPIEAKSGKNYEKHSAVRSVLSVKDYDISEALVFTNGNVKVSGNIVYMPIYMSMFVTKDDVLLEIIPPTGFTF